MGENDGQVGTIAQELPPPGEVSEARWARFVRRTRPQWDRLGAKLLRQWRTSFALEPEDVVQSMLMHAVKAHRQFDPTRGVPLGTYVVWCAMAGAKRAIHVDRQVQSHDRSRGPTQAPRPTSYYDARAAAHARLRTGELAPMVERAPSGECSAEQVLECLSLARTEEERAVLAALLNDCDLGEASHDAEFSERAMRRAYVAAAVCLSRAS